MNRRSFLRGAAGLLAAPAIVRVSSLMPVSTALPNLPDIFAATYPAGMRPITGVWYSEGDGPSIWLPFDSDRALYA